jgi:hypothetical protein
MSNHDRPLRVLALQGFLLFTLSITLWRVLDFIDEWLNAGFQMSLGQFRLSGSPALILQVFILFGLGICIYWSIRTLLTRP